MGSILTTKLSIGNSYLPRDRTGSAGIATARVTRGGWEIVVEFDHGIVDGMACSVLVFIFIPVTPAGMHPPGLTKIRGDLA